MLVEQHCSRDKDNILLMLLLLLTQVDNAEENIKLHRVTKSMNDV